MFGSRAEQHGQCHFTVDAALLAISHSPRSETHFIAPFFYLLRRRPLCISYPSPSEVQGGTKRLNSSGDCLPQLQGTVTDDLISTLREQKLLRPQLLNRIPQLRRLLKLKPFRRLAHVAFELADIRVDLFLRLKLRQAF